MRSVERYRQQEVKKAEPEIRKAIEAKHLGSIHAKVSSLTGAKAFWISVVAGVVASLILIPLAGLLYLGLRQSNLLGLVKDGPSGQPVKPVIQK